MNASPRIVLGLWPIAGVTTVGVTEHDALATIHTALDCGVTAFDSAFSYGYQGESDFYLGQCLASNRVGLEREQLTIMGKVGQRWTPSRQRYVDASPEQLTADAELSLKRMGIDGFDVLYLHSPDSQVPVERSAEAMFRLQQRGLCRQLGFCNASMEQYQQFAQVAPLKAIQGPLNLVQGQQTPEWLNWARHNQVQTFVFWTLMKGLLAGKIGRDHQFAEGDSRPGYEIFQGQQREQVHQAIDRLEVLAADHHTTVAKLSIGWALAQDGVAGALVGARYPEQVLETCHATALSDDLVAAVNAIVQQTCLQ